MIRCSAPSKAEEHAVTTSILAPEKRAALLSFDDTLNGCMVHGMACGDTRAHKAWDSRHGARVAGEHGRMRVCCTQGEHSTCTRPAIHSFVGRAPNLRRSGSQARAQRAKAPLWPTRAGGRAVQRCNGRHHATSASARPLHPLFGGLRTGRRPFLPLTAYRTTATRQPSVSADTLRGPRLCEYVSKDLWTVSLRYEVDRIGARHRHTIDRAQHSERTRSQVQVLRLRHPRAGACPQIYSTVRSVRNRGLGFARLGFLSGLRIAPSPALISYPT
jgi:hypothetical protein